MPLIIEQIKELKPYYFRVIQEYQKLETEISEIIENLGYSCQFFANKLKIPLSNFYYKRRTKSFTPNEMIQIINLLSGDDDDDDDMFDDKNDADNKQPDEANL